MHCVVDHMLHFLCVIVLSVKDKQRVSPFRDCAYRCTVSSVKHARHFGTCGGQRAQDGPNLGICVLVHGGLRGGFGCERYKQLCKRAASGNSCVYAWVVRVCVVRFNGGARVVLGQLRVCAVAFT